MDELTSKTVKDRVKYMAEHLPDDATWDDVRDQLNVIESIHEGLVAAAEGRVHSINEVRQYFGLAPIQDEDE